MFAELFSVNEAIAKFDRIIRMMLDEHIIQFVEIALHTEKSYVVSNFGKITICAMFDTPVLISV